ncbi:MAG: insulinase family protein [Alphaproteobacteria bacterium]|nr:insulinase family protein [Alphaproteobacteria bacterium]
MMIARQLAAFVLVGLSLALASCVTPGAPGAQTTATAATDSRPDYSYWPQDISDVKPDPSVRYGILPNGMRYAIMRNTQPAKNISLRLRIASGSLQETDPQRGLAHFMEHMAFNGSKNVPEGDYVKLLQRKGLAFGAHTNAYTSTDETVYMLELPKNDSDLVDTGLMLFREIGDRLTLDPKAIDREKGVVLSELRTRNTPEYRAFEERWKLWYDGQRQANRLPIGTAETIQGATRELLADYYSRFYRPERTLLVATGDFDPAEIEAKIKAKFSDWQAQDGPSADPDQGPVKQRGIVAASRVEANAPEAITVTWFQPPDYLVDTTKERELGAKRSVAFEVINRRFSRIERESNAPFVSASIGRSVTRGLSSSVTLSISARPGQWRRALTIAEQEVRRALQHGFHQSEIDREVKEWHAGLDDAVAKAGTRHTSGLANNIVNEFSGRGVFSHPSVDREIFNQYAPTLTAEAAQAELRRMIGGQGPVIFVSAGQTIEGGDAAIASAYAESQKTDVAAPEKLESKTFPYADFGPPGKVAERNQIADLEVTTVRFANGVRLNLKKTEFEKDTIYVGVRFAGGYIQMPRDKIGLDWALPFGFMEGGLKRLTPDELEEALTGRIVSTGVGLDEEAFEFGGRTNTNDLQLQMQLMAAFATDPAYRTNGIERLQAAAENYIKQYSSSPGRVLSRETPMLLRSGDPRWAFPTLKQMQALKVTDIENTLKPALETAPIEITIVGDINIDTAIAAVGTTFGALKPRAEKLAERPGARTVRFPATAASRKFEHEGRPDQASAYVAWPAPDFFSDPRRARTISLLREIMKVRLTEEFREKQGATYSPSVSTWYSGALPDFGYIAASAETRPELVEGFYATINEIIAELKAGKFDDDVVERARTPLIKSIETDRRSNGFWTGALEDIQTAPHALGTIRSQLSDFEGITKDEIVAAAKTYLDNKRRIEIRVLPKKVAATRAPDKSGELRSRASLRELALQD